MRVSLASGYLTLRYTGPGAAGSVWFQFGHPWRLLAASELYVGGMTAMSKLNARVLLLLLACLVGGVVFTMGIQATNSPSLRVGTTIRDPQEYLTQRLRHQAHLPLRVSTLSSQPGGVYTYATTYAFLGHTITLRTSTYLFDTNGTLLRMESGRYWPIFHFRQ